MLRFLSRTVRTCIAAWLSVWSSAGGLLAAVSGTGLANDPFVPLDTQTSGQPFEPHLAAGWMRVPDGFSVTLAASEPAVRQPIAVTFDDRGRLWVAESYSYDGSDFNDRHEDRILIFDDADGDGVFESRRVFADKLNRLTGLAWGFKGVWVLTAPTLSFLSDADGDDHPDGPATVHLDGWTLEAEHNSVNGLAWGPDGWLYGRHGNKEASRPGRPGTLETERPLVSCAIWRYHPTRHVFDVVADGTVNPWGHDWDELGQLFMSTSVMDHLWHVVPGSHFRRNAHVPVQEHVYELMDPINDHSHRPRRTPKGAAVDGGGGHSHVGTMIYLGDRWPEAYRGGVFLGNVMGRRVNHERLIRNPATGAFRATHAPDFLRANDPWFRSVSLAYGPDGDVIVTDWSDHGECHDRDGVSRSTGRIFKITWGEPRGVRVDLERATNVELAEMQWHRNEWFVRHARRLLQERAHGGAPMGEVHAALRGAFAAETGAARKLRALWTLHVTGGADRTWLESLLREPDEAVRYWAVRLLVDDSDTAQRAGTALIAAARRENSWLGRMALASALRELDADTRWELGAALVASVLDDADPNLIRLIWAGWGADVAGRPRAAFELAARTSASSLRRWTARRLAEKQGDGAAFSALLLEVLAQASSVAVATDLMVGAEAGLRARAGLRLESGDLAVLHAFHDSPELDARCAALRLGTCMGDEKARERLRTVLVDRREPLEWRREALQSLLAVRSPGLVSALLDLVAEPEIADAAIRALSAFEEPAIAPRLVQQFGQLRRTARAAAIDVLVSRPASAAVLVKAIATESVPKTELTRAQVRQLAALEDSAVRAEVERLFGRVNESSAAVAARIRKLRFTLKDAAYMATADLKSGHALFKQRCASCHALFDEGGKLGPDLTGSGRQDLDYLLTNILDPNASIAAEWRLTVATLIDGEVVTGSLAAEHADSVVLVTTSGPRSVSRNRIKTLERVNSSLMPAGLTDDLTVDQVRDLFGFLMSDFDPKAP